MIDHYFHIVYEDNYQNSSEVAASLFAGKSSCIHRKNQLIYTWFPSEYPKAWGCFTQVFSLLKFNFTNKWIYHGLHIQKINNDNCEKKPEVF